MAAARVCQTQHCTRAAAPKRRKCWRCIKRTWRAGDREPNRIDALIRAFERFTASPRGQRDRVRLARSARYYVKATRADR